jgi:hypothetical protein
VSATLAAVISLMSALIVALAGHVLSERRKRHDELIDLRLKAYTDFINSASRLVADRRLGKTQDNPSDLAALNDAKTRICICADPPVVDALAEFWHHGGTLEKEQGILAFTRLCMRIRESLGNKHNDIANHDISDTLFRLEPSPYSFRATKEAAFEDN